VYRVLGDHDIWGCVSFVISMNGGMMCDFAILGVNITYGLHSGS